MASQLRFQPWVGPNYNTAQSIFARPTFVLGGSSYSDGPETTPEEDAELTSNLIGYYFDGRKGQWKATYTRFINAIYGAESDTEMRRAYFDSVLFNNYLQEYAGGRPTDAAKFDYGAERHFLAFLEVIEQYRPEVIISWGNLVWNALPNDFGFGSARKEPPLDIMGTPFHGCMTYPYAGKEILLVGVTHPSSGFERAFHHQLFRRLCLLRLP